jgi:protein TonB
MIARNTRFEKQEKGRFILLEIGMIITLIVVLCAFNWKSYEKQKIGDYYRTVDDTPEELAPVTLQKRPEPPKINRPVVVHTINIVDDALEVDDDFVIDAEIDPLDTMPVYIPMPVLKGEEGPEEEEIFSVVESMPEFPGGEAAFYAYLRKNVVYPQFAKEAGISGKVYITFVVEKNGSITDVRLLRGIGGGCDEEALRVISAMPSWKPGLQRSHPVRVQFVVDIKFILEGI